MTNLAEVLSTARRYWEAKGASARMMPIRAEKCAEMLKLTHVGADGLIAAQWGTSLLTGLASSGLSKASQASYYAAFKRALALSGISTANWPKGPTPNRRVREPLSMLDVGLLRDWMNDRGWTETGALIAVLFDTGMRVAEEALNPVSWQADYSRNQLRITGKGGHERVIPVRDVHKAVLAMRVARGVSYSAHLKRWTKGVADLGIDSKLPTPHAIRHLFATRAYAKSGKNIRVVQELLGHSDPAVTARYIGVDMQELRAAIDG
jgi:site-specific recombinase XerD